MNELLTQIERLEEITKDDQITALNQEIIGLKKQVKATKIREADFQKLKAKLVSQKKKIESLQAALSETHKIANAYKIKQNQAILEKGKLDRIIRRIAKIDSTTEDDLIFNDTSWCLYKTPSPNVFNVLDVENDVSCRIVYKNGEWLLPIFQGIPANVLALFENVISK